MIKIERGTEAWRILEAMVANPNTRYIRLAVRQSNGYDEFTRPPEIMVSQNQEMWTHPLRVKDVNDA